MSRVAALASRVLRRRRAAPAAEDWTAQEWDVVRAALARTGRTRPLA